MRLYYSPLKFTLISWIILFFKNVRAGPYPRYNLHGFGFSYLQDRSCTSHCGAENQYCCAANEACYTNQANVAFCSAVGPNAAGGYVIYTTTYTETNLILRTSTYTSSWAPVTSTYQPDPIATASPICTTSLGESSCGNICCASNQRCAFANSCTAHTGPAESSTYSAPVRPTSGDVFTISATKTVPFEPPATASGSTFPVASADGNNNLSGGAIAGIVIGVIAGFAFILLFCFCCVIKSSSALFGLGKSKKQPHRVDNSSSQTDLHGQKRSSNIVKFLIAFGAAALAIFGLKKKLDKEKASLRSERQDDHSTQSSQDRSHSPGRSSTSEETESIDSRISDSRTDDRRPKLANK